MPAHLRERTEEREEAKNREKGKKCLRQCTVMDVLSGNRTHTLPLLWMVASPMLKQASCSQFRIFIV